MNEDINDRDLLGVKWDASPQEVTRAYHRRALRDHPDKTGGDARVFVALQQAYHRIVHREEGQNDQAQCIDPGVSILPLIYAFLLKVMALWAALQRYKHLTVQTHAEHASVTVTDVSDVTDVTDVTDVAERHTPATIVVDITVTLDDVYYARTKKLVLRVHSKNDGDMMLQKVLIPLLQHQDSYLFPGMGDVDGELTGDVAVNLSVTPHISGARIDDTVNRYDLHVSVKTTIYDFVFGRQIVITDIPGGDIRVQYGGHEQRPLTHVALVDRGLPFTENGVTCRGSLYVFFQLQALERPNASLAALESMTCRQLLSALSGISHADNNSNSSNSSNSNSNINSDCLSSYSTSSDTDSDRLVSSWNDLTLAWT